MQSLLTEFEVQGGIFVANTEMLSAVPENHGFTINLKSVDDLMSIHCDYLINSGGLHSTKLAVSIESLSDEFIPQLHWCRGHYFSYSGKSPFRHLIYPIPESAGLGIHASLDIGGQLKFGPDTEYIEQLKYGVDVSLKDKFYQAISKYFPTIEREKLQPAYSSIRPKLQRVNDGFQDFMIHTYHQHHIRGLINLFGIDSPGLTSSLAIADYVAKAIIDD